MKKAIHYYCPINHFKAIVFRRWVIFKRSYKTILLSSVGTLIFSILGIAVKWIMNALTSPVDQPVDFNIYQKDVKDIPIVGTKSNFFTNLLLDKISSDFLKQRGEHPNYIYFDTVDSLQSYIYQKTSDNDLSWIIPFGLDFSEVINSHGGLDSLAPLNILYNATSNPYIEPSKDLKTYAVVIVGNALWELLFNDSKDIIDVITQDFVFQNNLPENFNDFSVPEINFVPLDFSSPPSNSRLKSLKKFNQTELKTDIQKFYENYQSFKADENNGDSTLTVAIMEMKKNISTYLFESMMPLLLVCGLLTTVPLLVAPIVIDIRGEVRQYMMQCTLKLIPYWLGTFVIDYGFWVLLVTIVWGIFNIGMVEGFNQNMFSTWFTLVIYGLSFLLFLYCFQFCFKSPSSAPRQIFILLILLLFISVVVTSIIPGYPSWLDWIWVWVPPIALEHGLIEILQRVDQNQRGYGFFYRNEKSQPYMIMQWLDPIFYMLLLMLIETLRKKFENLRAKRSFLSYSDYFDELKKGKTMAPETKRMEIKVKRSHNWAVRIKGVSRLFIDTAGEPIAAVNDVSLGVKTGVCFGFLGANGAGKTTLMRMIIGNLPTSKGTIEIFGTEIQNQKDKTISSICPQFNNHLFELLTPREHFQIYAWLFQMDDNEAETKIRSLINDMRIFDFQNKPVVDLSIGDVRKLTIALSFFGPSKLLLLDEPTASLDPVACNCVQQMIFKYRKDKTFMLCTHILEEAETLCDQISIMVRGIVYTVGSPQYLTQKFGTEFKIDIMLDDDSIETVQKIDRFFANRLPQAEMLIKRPTSRIYSIPATSIQLPELFLTMQEGKDGDNGFKYFTCSTSSLEKVFMEIIRLSEHDGLIKITSIDNLPITELDEEEDQNGAELDEKMKLAQQQREEPDYHQIAPKTTDGSGTFIIHCNEPQTPPP